MRSELEEGLQRAREHLGCATVEMLEAARVLLDASLRASGLHSVAPDSLAGEIGRNLDTWVSALRDGGPFRLPDALGDPLAEALESEIARWQARSRTDADARPVLRAFLGLRELLWELGVRAQPEAGSSRAPQPREAPKAGTRTGTETHRREPTRSRVQRFDIED